MHCYSPSRATMLRLSSGALALSTCVAAHAWACPHPGVPLPKPEANIPCARCAVECRAQYWRRWRWHRQRRAAQPDAKWTPALVRTALKLHCKSQVRPQSFIWCIDLVTGTWLKGEKLCECFFLFRAEEPKDELVCSTRSCATWRV